MGPENRFIQRVHKHLSKSVYREKMHNAYRGGTPDVWYSGPKGDLWIEYKWVAKLPKNKLLRAALSALQLDWLVRRKAEGRRVYVAVGYPEGCCLLNLENEWRDGYKFVGPGHPSAEDLAKWIEGQCA